MNEMNRDFEKTTLKLLLAILLTLCIKFSGEKSSMLNKAFDQKYSKNKIVNLL